MWGVSGKKVSLNGVMQIEPANDTVLNYINHRRRFAYVERMISRFTQNALEFNNQCTAYANVNEAIPVRDKLQTSPETKKKSEFN